MSETKRAITIKEITGSCIPTIPVGTSFEVQVVVKSSKRNYGYSTCKGLPVSSVWNDEYVLVKGQSE
jgi:hypothetical protein